MLTGFIASYCLMSLLEWYVHRYHMHRRGWFNRFSPDWFIHHKLIHHQAYKRDFTEANPEAHKHIGVESNPISMLKAAVPMSILLGVLWPCGGICFFITAMFHSLAWTAFHEEMHMPKNKWFARTFWYKACLKHHELHHKYPNKNFCALYLGADYIFGTKIG